MWRTHGFPRSENYLQMEGFPHLWDKFRIQVRKFPNITVALCVISTSMLVCWWEMCITTQYILNIVGTLVVDYSS
jgi:hypothetical protein